MEQDEIWKKSDLNSDGLDQLDHLVDPQRVFLSGSDILPLPAHVLNVNLTNALSENAETVIKNETMTRAALSAPRFGLSWSPICT